MSISSVNRQQTPFETEPLMWHVGTRQSPPVGAGPVTPLEPVEEMQLHVAPGGTIMGRAIHTREDGLIETQLDWRLPEIQVDMADAEWRACALE